MSRRREMVAMGGGLPYDERLVYIRSLNENHRINTGISCGTSSFVKAAYDIRFVSSPSYAGISANAASWFGSINGVYSIGGGNTISLDTSIRRICDFEVRYATVFYNRLTVGGSTVVRTGEVSAFNKYFTIGCFWTNLSTTCDAEFYGVEITDGSTVLGNFIPVLKDGIPCVYETISGEFKYNLVSGHQFGYKKLDGTIVQPT